MKNAKGGDRLGHVDVDGSVMLLVKWNVNIETHFQVTAV
jgi:hypothetical protein